MEINSIIDVITNSSSEVFIIRYNKKLERKDIIQILMDLFESLGLDINDYLDWWTMGKDGRDPEYNTPVKRGDLILYSNEAEKHRIPAAISYFIEEFKTVDEGVKSIRRMQG